MTNTPAPTGDLTKDAKNRAVRAAVVNLTTDVAVAVGMVLFTAFSQADSWGSIQWSILLFSVVKTMVVTALSFVLRRFVDPSSIPTPLPPDVASPPTESVEESDLPNHSQEATGDAHSDEQP